MVAKGGFFNCAGPEKRVEKRKNGLPGLYSLATCKCFIIFALVFVRSWKQDVSEITDKTALLIV